jgi:O-antigen/teichoic acid export membrane protein
VVTTLFPRTAASETEESKQFTALLCRNALWITVLLGGLFLLVSKPLIVFVFGIQFAPAALALIYLMPGVAGQVVSRICFTDCAARGFPEKATYATVITALITVVLDILLIPRLGINGAAIASSAAYCTSGLLGLFWHCRISLNRPLDLLLVKPQDLSFYYKIGHKIRIKIKRT